MKMNNPEEKKAKEYKFVSEVSYWILVIVFLVCTVGLFMVHGD